MKWHRIWAMTLRHLRQLSRDFNETLSIFFWPFINILLFGFIGLWMARDMNDPTRQLQLLAGIMVLQIINRSTISTALCLFDELRSRNLTNLFASPLTLQEWIVASCLKGLITCGILFAFCGLVIKLIFNINVLAVGLWFIPIIVLALLSSLSLGFVAIAVLLRWGMDGNSVIWMVAQLFNIVSGALYPIAIIPQALQTVAYYLPFVYQFDALHLLIKSNIVSARLLLLCLFINLFYLVITYALLVRSFKKSMRLGLERLMD
ncbi:MAG: ABC transporter permease [Candidatus Dependentiae bacterium]|nr:ABC transporter permease [Candidatus Dependentiae bacterium]